MTLPSTWSQTHNGLFYHADGTGPYVFTDFDAGRDFRSFLEFNIGAGATQVIRVTASIPFTLKLQTFAVDDGQLRFAAVAGAGTPGGTFSTALPTVGTNRLLSRPLPYYASQVVLDTGGTHTGGTEVEVVRIKAAGASAQASTVGTVVSTLRSLPIGVYYLRFQNIGAGTVTGVYSLEWSEHPDDV